MILTGVIEPSSAHSIVQTAGRINRHRLREVSQPNVAILQHNRRWLNGKPGEPCFVWPGLESESSTSLRQPRSGRVAGRDTI